MNYNGVKITDSILHRFYSKIAIPKDKNKCWIWTACKDGCGYGTLRIENRVGAKTHRLMYLLTKGKLIKGLEICHTCDNPSCVNPNHLEQKTHKENILDCAKRNRTWDRSGEKNVRAILTEKEVKTIRRNYKYREYTYSMIMKEYGLAKTTVGHIIHRRSWGYLK